MNAPCFFSHARFRATIDGAGVIHPLRSAPGRKHDVVQEAANAPERLTERPAVASVSRRSASGFTLLEVLVSMAIIGITLLGVYQAYLSSIHVLTANRSTWEAILQGNRALMAAERLGATRLDAAQGELREGQTPKGARWTRQIEDDEPFSGVMVRKLTYTLEWKEGKSQRRYQVSTYLPP